MFPTLQNFDMNLTSSPFPERRRNDQTGHSQGQKTGCSLRNNFIELLFNSVDTAKEKAHSHNQEQVGQHTSNQGSLHNGDFVVDEGDDADDQLDCVAKTGIQQTAKRFSSSVGIR